MELKTLNTVHLSFCIAVIVFAAVAYSIVGSAAYFSTQLGSVSPYYLLLPLAGLIAITIGTSLYTKAVSKAKEEPSFEYKLIGFKKAFLVRCALVEGSAFLNIVGFILSNNLIFLAFAGISLLSLFSYRLNRTRLIDDLQIAPSDTPRL